RSGGGRALDALVAALADDVYGLALRMTANRPDAEDATQEALLKIATHLGGFRGEASVRTWAYRIALRHLLDRRKSRVEAMHLDFERFGHDLLDGLGEASGDAAEAEEVKLGCSLAMLTCLDRDHRVAYILGDVFDLPNRAAAEIAGASEPVYRQRLSRARRQVEAFTKSYCGVVDSNAPCRCDRRVGRAIELGRLQRDKLDLALHPKRQAAVQDMESLHGAARLFRTHPAYATPAAVSREIARLMTSAKLSILEDPPE
ncbi:MAG TPA: RNA polymerase sigma factor, partial [Burkholderiales bacterium]|nr:RNA polymerase sigma factor [Burkholderiales bacterium]